MVKESISHLLLPIGTQSWDYHIITFMSMHCMPCRTCLLFIKLLVNFLTQNICWCFSVGKSANHALIMANLKIKDVSYGMHPFIVQIRDLTTHQPLPGRMLTQSNINFALPSGSTLSI